MLNQAPQFATPSEARTPCRCWGCRKELGTTDGAVLYLSALVHVRRPLTLWCVCGGATFWRPVKHAIMQEAQRECVKV